MKKVINYIKNHLLCSYVIINILFILITSCLYTYKISSYKLNSRLYILFLVLNIIAILTHIIIKKRKKEKLRFNIFDIFLLIFLGFTLLSSILSINTESAFFGFRDRYEGFFQISYYFSIFLLSSFLNKEEKKIIAYAIITLGVIEVIHAHLQKFELLNIPVLIKNGKPWVTGYTSNPNFLGTITILCLSIAIGLFFDSKSINEKVIYFILIIIFMSGLLISDTLSALVGLIAVLVYVIFFAFKKNKKMLLLITVIILSIMTAIYSLIGNTSLVNDLIKTKNQSIEIAKGNVQDNFGTNRMFIWRESLKVVPKNLTYGVGVDNFYYAFGGKPLVRKYRYFDKAHNEYLQVLICQGLYALVSYLVFVGIILIRGIKYSFKSNKLYLIVPVIAYLVQAFFNISVIEIAPLFFIYLGLCSIRDKKEL